MARRFTRPGRQQSGRFGALTVEGGRVVCPARGNLDIEQCFFCSSYRGMVDGPSERLLCEPASGTELAYLPFGAVPR